MQGELNKIKQEIQLISYLHSEITNLKDWIQSSNQINYTQQQLEDIDVAVANLRNSIDSYSKDIDYQKKLLDNQSQTSVILPQHFNDLKATVTQLQSRIENLDNRTSEVLKMTSELSRSSFQEVINQTINPFTEELDSVKINLDSLLSSIESINLSDLKQAVTNSASKLMEIDYISEKVALFHKELNAVNEQLNLN